MVGHYAGQLLLAHVSVDALQSICKQQSVTTWLRTPAQILKGAPASACLLCIMQRQADTNVVRDRAGTSAVIGALYCSAFFRLSSKTFVAKHKNT